MSLLAATGCMYVQVARFGTHCKARALLRFAARVFRSEVGLLGKRVQSRPEPDSAPDLVVLQQSKQLSVRHDNVYFS